MRTLKAVSYCFALLIISLHAYSCNSSQAQTTAIVYHTPYGKKYHTADCHFVDNTSNSISIEDAKKRGFGPCSFCKPDVLIASNPEALSKREERPGQKAEATQCKGTTQKGLRCKRRTNNANGYCFQHLPSK